MIILCFCTSSTFPPATRRATGAPARLRRASRSDRVAPPAATPAMVKRKAGKLPRTKSGVKKARLQGKLRKAHVPQGVIRDAWDARRTSAQNLARIGLCPAVNAITPVVAPSARRNAAAARARAEGAAAPAPTPAAPLGTGRDDVCDRAARADRADCAERADVARALEEQAARPERVAPRVMRPGEEAALAAMQAAHKDDYDAMARDIKRNYLQWTPAQLRKKFQRRRQILQDAAAAATAKQ